MNESQKKNFLSFDSIFQNSPFHMIKFLLPFLPASSQKTIAIFIKFFELKYTIDFFNSGKLLYSMADSIDLSNPMEMMSAMKDFFPKDQQENVDNIFQMLQAMEMMQAFQGDDPFTNPLTNGNPSDMFQMFSGMFESNSSDPPADCCSQEEPCENEEPISNPINYEQ